MDLLRPKYPIMQVREGHIGTPWRPWMSDPGWVGPAGTPVETKPAPGSPSIMVRRANPEGVWFYAPADAVVPLASHNAVPKVSA